jgi:hypothetical protein
MNIPESIIQPFGYTGIPFIRLKCDPEAIAGTLHRLMGHLRGLTSEDIKESLEAAVLILGANTAACHIYRSNYPEEVGDNFSLRYILPNDEQAHNLYLKS